MKYESLNYIDIDSVLSEEQKMIRKMCRDFAIKEVDPLVTESFNEGEFPRQLATRLGELGFLGSNLEGYGCQGLDSISYGLIMQELERADSGVRSFASVQGALCMWPIYTYGSEEQKNKFLPLMAKGEKIGCFGLTEPDFGSDPSGMLTNAKDAEGGYILNGNKMWITNGCIADLAIVWAKHNGQV
ncbi:MAG: acyl-CoA dehydrogenase family protein, partial [Bacteriovoracaceae bacterium]